MEIDGKKIEFRSKGTMNSFKDDCLWSKCPVDVSTQEAVYWGAEIRCCEDEGCKQFAAEFASKAGEVFPGTIKNSLH